LLNNYIKKDKNKINLIFNTNKINKNYEFYHINDTTDYVSYNIIYMNKNIDIKLEVDKYAIINDTINLILLINNKNVINYKKFKNNIIFKESYKLNGFALKNILFNINNKYVYKERKLLLDKQYKDDDKIVIELIYFKTIIETNFESKNNNILIYSDLITKLKIISLLKNNNSLMLLNKGLINFFNFEKENINTMIYQSLNKWIYNKYSGDEIDNLLVVEIIRENNIINKIILLDKNIKKSIEQKKLLDNRLFFIELIFINSKIFKNKKEKYNEIIINFDNIKYYYKIDGIKYSSIIFNIFLNNNSNEN